MIVDIDRTCAKSVVIQYNTITVYERPFFSKYDS
jgi:hypothetical protein